MFRSVRIQNFRQFKDLKLENLGRINLITGQNNTGKTSLLEALFLLSHPDDPSRTVTLAGLRGIDRSSPETPELWDWLFTDRDTSQTIEVTTYESGQIVADAWSSKFEIRVARGSHLPISGTNGNGSGAVYVTSAEPLPELTYGYIRPVGARLDTSLRWTNQGLLLDPDRRFEQRTAKRGFFLSDAHHPSERDADRLSDLELNGREQPVIDALQLVEPRLKRLTILTHAGRPSVYADLGQRPLVPLAMMGQGFSRLLTIMSALTLGPGAMVLIDEMGGFHYSRLPGIWKAIIAAAHQHDVQLFVTTHSLEAIEAAVEGSEDYEGSLAFYRLERQKTGEIGVIAGEDRRLRSAVKVGAELR